MRTQFVYAVSAQELKHVVPEGYTRMPKEPEYLTDEKYIYLGQREQLENNPSFWHLIPYVILRQDNKVFLYQRTNKIGESRLVGNTSVGFGGHVDLNVTLLKPGTSSSVDICATLANGMYTEFSEELRFTDKATGLAVHAKDAGTLNFLGVIRDTSNAVGLHHLGLAYELNVNSGVNVKCAEDALVTIGFTNPSSIDTSLLENWSKLVLGL